MPVDPGYAELPHPNPVELPSKDSTPLSPFYPNHESGEL